VVEQVLVIIIQVEQEDQVVVDQVMVEAEEQEIHLPLVQLKDKTVELVVQVHLRGVVEVEVVLEALVEIVQVMLEVMLVQV
tara:strand:- start:179 stop:421 length:243 start_codon:yes stop_codon:yes gene_type:complete